MALTDYDHGMMSVPKPMLAQSSDALPLGPAWTYEVKWDGYRSIAVKDGACVKLWSRNQKDLTRDYPGIEAALGKLRSPSFVIDGEIVALPRSGRRRTVIFWPTQMTRPANAE